MQHKAALPNQPTKQTPTDVASKEASEQASIQVYTFVQRRKRITRKKHGTMLPQRARTSEREDRHQNQTLRRGATDTDEAAEITNRPQPTN
jgi:hypothetical protein